MGWRNRGGARAWAWRACTAGLCALACLVLSESCACGVGVWGGWVDMGWGGGERPRTRLLAGRSRRCGVVQRSHTPVWPAHASVSLAFRTHTLRTPTPAITAAREPRPAQPARCFLPTRHPTFPSTAHDSENCRTHPLTHPTPPTGAREQQQARCLLRPPPRQPCSRWPRRSRWWWAWAGPLPSIARRRRSSKGKAWVWVCVLGWGGVGWVGGWVGWLGH